MTADRGNPSSVDLDIVRLGAQGDGVADMPSRETPVYVPFALPGERVRVDCSTPERTALREVLSPSAERRDPVCRHFRSCGGCVAQHMSAGLYRSWKLEMVRAAFAHRGLAPPIAELVTVGTGARRRAAMQAVRRVGGRGENSGASVGLEGETAIELGFHAEGSHEIVPIVECAVMAPAIVAALPALRAVADVILRQSEAKKTDAVDLTVTATPAGLDVAVGGRRWGGGRGGGSGGSGKNVAASLVVDADRRAALGRLAAASGLARLTLGSELVVQRAVPCLEPGGVSVELPAGAFTQATAAAEVAIAAIIEGETRKARRIADLFAGIGTFTFAMARRARVLAVDSDGAAMAALAAAARHAQGLKPIETRTRDLLREPLSRKELEGLDAVVFDPPRAGAQRQAELLACSPVPVVVAVSCNPATLARDARILIDGGYELTEVTPIDQFLWSAHIEAVAVFRRV